MPILSTHPSCTRPTPRSSTAPRFGYAVHVQGHDLTRVHNEVDQCRTNRNPSSFLTLTEIHEVKGKQNIQEVYLDQTHLDSFLSRSQAANTQRSPATPDLQPEYPIKSFSTYNYAKALGRHVTFQGPEADISGLLEEPGIGLILDHLAETQASNRQQRDGLDITVWPNEAISVEKPPQEPDLIFRIPVVGRVLKWLLG